MNNKLYLLVVFFFGILGMNAQSDYYYYNNEKIYIEVDTKFISINSSSGTTDYLKRASVEYFGISPIVEDNVIKYLNASGTKASQKSYYYEIELSEAISNDKDQYASYLEKLNTVSEISKASPAYKTNGGKRLGLTDKFYVKLKSDADADVLYATAKANGLEVLGKDPYMPLWYVVKCTKENPKNAVELANQFHESKKFATAEPAFAYHDLQTSVDPLFNDQWGLKNTGQYGSAYTGIDIKAEQAWTLATGTGIKTAIFDHGFEMNHPDLAGNNFGTGFDAINASPPSVVRGNHGTACAGIAGAVQNNSLGTSGVAPTTQLMSISINLVFADTPLQLASGFNWARTNGADVISNSWGGYAPSTIITDAITDAINLGRGGKGCVVVFAAGNENNTTIRYPGSALPDVLVVGAMSPCGQRKSPTSCDGEGWGSCYGTQLDVVAPGVKMATTDRQGSSGYTLTDYNLAFNGTSSACPVVAGVCALILSANPCLTSQEVRDIIELTSQKVGGYSYTTTAGRPNGTWNNEMGYGLVNAYAAVQMAQQLYSPTVDLLIKDTPADSGIEPNTVSPYMWASEDIWIRNSADNGLIHQNPEYSPSTPNHVYVRVKNKSCVASLGNETVKLYWAKAGTSLGWPNSWNGTYFISGVLMGNQIGTVTVPALQPGEETIVHFTWNSMPNPSNYSGINPEPWHFCLLARVDATSDPMTFPETTDLNLNVKNNNNIAWKNITIVDAIPNRPVGGVIGIGNPTRLTRAYNLEFIAENPTNGRPIFEQAEVIVKMDARLNEKWLRGGGQGGGFEDGRERGTKILRGEAASLKNITFEPNELNTLNFTVRFLSEDIDQENFVCHIVQRDARTGEVVGGETYNINRGKKGKNARMLADAGATQIADKNDVITLSASQASEAATYNWYDAKGNLVFQGKDMTISVDMAKKYKLEVIALSDGFKDYAEVEVKLKPSSLGILAPNPAKNKVGVSYKLNDATSAYLMVVGSYGTAKSSNNYILDLNSEETSIDISGYKEGLYQIALVCNGKIVDVKTLIKK